MERLRNVKIVVEIDTNKSTRRDEYELAEDESVTQLLERVKNVTELRMEQLL